MQDQRNQEKQVEHPLRLKGDEVASTMWQYDKNHGSDHPKDTLDNLEKFNQLMNMHLPGFPDLEDPKFKLIRKVIGEDFKKLGSINWKLMKNTLGQTLAFAMIPFNPNNPSSELLTEGFTQYFTETLHSFGARYGKSKQCWILYLPNFDKLTYIQLEQRFLQELKLSWLRVSNQFHKHSLLITISFEDVSNLDRESTEELSNSNAISNSNANSNNYQPGVFYPPFSPVQYKDPRSVTLKQSHIKTAIIMDYLRLENIQHFHYNEVMDDPYLHPELKKHAESLLKSEQLVFTNPNQVNAFLESNLQQEVAELNQLIRQPNNVLIMCLDPNSEFKLLDKKLDEAVAATMATKEYHRVLGSLNDLSIEKAAESQIMSMFNH